MYVILQNAKQNAFNLSWGRVGGSKVHEILSQEMINFTQNTPFLFYSI